MSTDTSRRPDLFLERVYPHLSGSHFFTFFCQNSDSLDNRAFRSTQAHSPRNHRFTFTGKERDSETSYSYFGARYYDSDLSSLFLSIDPMADKYPGLSPYAYCAWNPLKLVDPSGDTIKNAYESYKDINEDVKYYQDLMDNTSNQNEKLAYNNEIVKLKKMSKSYHIVNDLIGAFEKTNGDEYAILNNLSFNGKPVNVIVGLSDLASNPQDGSVGLTSITYGLDQNNNVQSIKKPGIQITIYKNGFADGHNGVGTLANEFGDALYGVAMAQHNKDTWEIGSYFLKPTTRFSYDYEKYIISPTKYHRPDPKSYKAF